MHLTLVVLFSYPVRFTFPPYINRIVYHCRAQTSPFSLLYTLHHRPTFTFVFLTTRKHVHARARAHTTHTRIQHTDTLDVILFLHTCMHPHTCSTCWFDRLKFSLVH